ncbi:hypothetical protein CC77DRAFT_570286 [Alternaria alternata]|uniref:3-carboxymuconate cyclase n=2 Tax=Alternaria alternata complex TaxID=187734 RepID=A0A177D3U3_ALTAL|nr:hypothetical protein CC77DRAFT_570286 [Alternaria alternata]XP_051586452.1 uncharacterized protein J4E82_007562 [Alternaria postmessia]RYN21666.1 hypothetical protein AA0115_g9591 [Alternaria tenuissima]KAI5373749.1 hypothetical protein J4E82_007562 [Alternaria postmessia]OAG14314.1 hypothetical protein CC77DRAFT_570286 [Alternaria alternata]RYN51125.1 hypothetical protein AA0118_g10624 [Alternaria tenuissima]
MFAKTILLALLPSVAVAAPHQQHRAGADQAQQHGGMSCMQQPNAGKPAVGRAIYMLTNDADNAVVALPIGADGMLSKGKVMKTGGAGSVAVDAEGKPATPDALVGQSALTIAGNNLFAVNAGSNTLTMMTISSRDATSLSCVGKPLAIPGEFPNTVAASAKNKLACVGTTGAKAGISCASFSRQGLGQMDELRSFDLGQSTPPVGPLNTVSQTFFSSDESALFTTVKGDPTVNNTGFLSTYSVQASNGAATLSKKDVRSSPNGTAVLFGSATLSNDPSTLFVTDASFGATVLSIDSKGQATVKGKQAIDGQAATCWATISDATNSAFVTDVGVNRVVEMSLDDASIIKQLDLSANGDPGLIDLRAAGDFVYALSPGNGTTAAAIMVLDVSGGQGSMKQVQHFDLSGMAGKNAQGMAVLM